jgi:histidine ammonia-lyase
VLTVLACCPHDRDHPAARAIHDAFVFRCVPQVEGTLLDALEHLAGVPAIELNVAGENALLLPRDGVALPNGNFHAGVLTLALDSLRGAMAQSASLVAARVSALLDPDVTGLTPQLALDPGPDSGAMILEYTAHAAALPEGAGVRGLHDAAAARLDPDMADRPLSGDLEAARQLLFEDALWMESEAPGS